MGDASGLTQEDETGSILLKLLEDNPDPPLFCLHQLLQGSSHVCMQHNHPPEVCMQQDHPPQSVPIFSTPVQLRKVTSPQNLELDSDTSNVGGWSLSMATPTVQSVTKGDPLPVSSLLSTTCESSTLTEEGGEASIFSDESVVRGDKWSSEKDEKVKKRVMIKRHKPVVRTLFPRIKSPTESPNFSPILQPDHMTTSTQANSTVPTASLFKTPIKHTTEDLEEAVEGAPCSQELFGSPEIFTPKVPVTCSPTVEKCESEQCVYALVDCEDGKKSKEPSPDWDRKIISPEEALVNTPGAYLTHPLVHSTPLYQDSQSPVYNQTSLRSASVRALLSHAAAPARCNPVTPQQKACTETVQETPAMTKASLGEEDVFDLLFMSKSQLDSRFSAKSESSSAKNELVPSESEETVPVQMDGGTKNQEENKLQQSLHSTNVTDNRMRQSTPEPQATNSQSPAPEIKPPASKKMCLTTKTFSYPSNTQLTKAKRKRMRIRETKFDAFKVSVKKDAPAELCADSVSPPHKRACVDAQTPLTRESSDDKEVNTEVKEGETIMEKVETGTGALEEQAVTTVDESFVTDDKTNSEMIVSVVMESQETKTVADKAGGKDNEALSCEQGLVRTSDLHPELKPTLPEGKCDGSKTSQTYSSITAPIPEEHVTTATSIEGGIELAKSTSTPTSLVSTVTKPPLLTRVSGLRRSFGGNLHKKAIKPTDLVQLSTNVQISSSSPPDPLATRDKQNTTNPPASSSFVGFQTASGGSISVSEAALDQAKQLIGEELQSEYASEITEIKSFTGPRDCFRTPTTNSGQLTSSDTAKSLPSFGSFTTPSLPKPLVTPNSNRQSVQTPPTMPGMSVRRAKPKPFKAPRSASSVSDAEERASVARILRKFGVKSAATPQTGSTKERRIETGFSTASGTKLSASHSSVMKAKRLLASDKENGMETELIEDRPVVSTVGSNRNTRTELTGFKTASGKGLSVSSMSLEKAKKLVSEEGKSSTPQDGALSEGTLPPVGFHTAAGRSITVSSEAIARAKLLIEGIEDKIPYDDREDTGSLYLTAPTGFHTAGGSSISISKNSPQVAQRFLSEDDEELHGPSHLSMGGESMVDKIMTGFCTAGGNTISVSSESIRKVEKILSDEDRTGVRSKSPLKQEISETDYTSCLSIKDVECLDCFTQVEPLVQELLPPVNNLKRDEDDADCVDESASCYFNTQVVKQFLDFSAEEESDVDTKLKDRVDSPVEHDVSQEKEWTSHGTPMKTNVSLSSLQPETPDCGDNLLDISGASMESPSNSELSPVVSKVNGRSGQFISEKPTSPSPTNVSMGVRLSDLEATFSSDLPAQLDASNLSTVGDAFTKSMIDKMDTSVMSCCQTVEEETDISKHEEERTDLLQADFSLGTTEHAQLEEIENKREDSPSVHSAQRDGNEDMDTTLCEQGPHRCGSNAKTTGKDTHTVEPVGEKSRSQVLSQDVHVQMPAESVPDTPPRSPGVGDELVTQITSKESSGFAGFTTAGGRKVDISHEALAAVRLKFSDEDDTKMRPLPSLQTASGKEVSVSEESLKAVRARLGVDTGESANRTFPGLQTASGKEVSVSEESLKSVRARLGVDTGESANRTFPGLQTASGKKVEVSEQALEAARATLGDTEKNSVSQSHGLPSLQTTSGKQVEISERSLHAVRDTPDRLPGLHTASGKEVTISEHSLLSAKARLDSSTSHAFPGLQTASGQKVDISHEHLQAARATLDRTPTNIDPLKESCTSTEDGPQGGWSVELALGAAKSSLIDDSNLSTFQPPIVNTRTIGQSSALAETTSTATSTAKYKPVFKPSARNEPQNKRGGTSERPSAVTGHPQRRLGVSSRGFISTPEGSLQDRHPSRSHSALLPTQTFLNNDGSYFSSQPRSQRIYNTPHRVRTRNQSSVNSSSASLHSGPNRPTIDSSTRADSYSTSTGQGSRLTTPVRSWRSATRNVRPVWKASIGHKTQGIARIEGRGPGRVLTSEPAPSVKNTLNFKQSPSPSTSNTVDPPCSLKDHSSPPEQSGEQDCQTNTNPAFSPLHITLSQVCAMEDSQQNMLDQEEDRKEGPSDKEDVTQRGKREDSGYVSREVSSVRSPSPRQDKAEKMASQLKGNPADDTLTAEVAMDILNDSLELDLSAERPATSQVQCENKQVTRKDMTDVRTSASSLRHTPSVPSSTSVPCKPMPGTLLSIRSAYKRVSLLSAVHHRPPGGYSVPDLLALGVSSNTLSVSSSNARNYQFQGSLFFSSSVLGGAPVCVGDGVELILRAGVAGVNEFWEGFQRSPGVDERLISFEWFSNHYRQLAWKLASMEVAYPCLFAGQCLTPDWLLLQLKYRYDREIDRAERSAIRKICEHDDLPSRRMVLCISNIDLDRLEQSTCDLEHRNREMESGNVTVDSSLNETKSSPDSPCIELTDGWYTLPCAIDRPLRHMIKYSKVTVGSKLMVFGAELVGLSSPCHPLEIPTSCHLKLSTNSTRRARWFARLGYQTTPHPFPIPLPSVYSDGGLVGCTDVVISRVYPLVYLEKREGAKGVFRSERQERRIVASFEKERQRKIEEVCSRVQKEFEEELAKTDAHNSGSRRRSRRLNILQIKQLEDGEEIHTGLSNAPDPVAFQELLSPTQLVLLESYHQSLVERRQSQLQERVRLAIQEAEEKLPQQRKVTPLLKVRVVPCGGCEDVDCVLSVWRPDESVWEILKEGSVLRLTHLNTHTGRSKFNLHRIQLTATRSTIYRPLTSAGSQALVWYSPRGCSLISYLNELGGDCRPPHGELDTVGVVAFISSCHVTSHDLEGGEGRQLDSVFLADSEENLLLIKVWDGLEARCLHDVVQPGALLAVTNLTYRGLDHAHGIPTATAGDTTLFSQRPSEPLRTAVEELRGALPEIVSEYLDTLQDKVSHDF